MLIFLLFYMVKKVSESNGITSFVLSICGFIFVLIPVLALGLSILAIVFAKKQRKISKTGLGDAGFIIGIIGTIVNGLYNLYWLLIFVSVAISLFTSFLSYLLLYF